MPKITELQCKNPATDEFLGTIPLTSTDACLRDLAELQSAQKVLQLRTAKQRKQLVIALQAALLDECDEVTLVINKSTGKSREAGLREIFLAAQALAEIDVAAVDGRENRPISLILSSPDYPLYLPLRALFEAIIAGSTVMLVAANDAAMVAKLILRLVKKCPDLAPFVRVSYLTKATLEELPIPDWVEPVLPSGFRVDWPDRSDFPKSNSAVLVLNNANIELCVSQIAPLVCLNAGQSPIAIDRIYVLKSLYQPFIDALSAEVENLTFGYSDQLKDLHDYGPLVSQEHTETVATLKAEALEQGAPVVWGGAVDRNFLQPTILGHCTSKMAVVELASNSPLIPVIACDTMEEAVTEATNYPMLACSIWSDAEGIVIADERVEGDYVVNQPYTKGFFISAESFSSVFKPPEMIIEQLNQPGNYRLLKTVMMAQFGTNPSQKMQALDLFRNSYKVQQMVNSVSEKAAKWRKSN